jgi:predicted RNA-binding protein YlxR (DUF448 family)
VTLQRQSTIRHQPQRTCIACGAKNKPEALLRVRFNREQLTLGTGPDGRKLIGRSAYLCPRAACVEKSIAKRAFARSFRTNAYVSDALKQQLRAAVENLNG